MDPNFKYNKGNNTKIDLNNRIFNKSIPPATTNFTKKTKKGLSILSESDVEFAKEFSEENQL